LLIYNISLNYLKQMGAQYSNVDNLKKNKYLTRLVDTETIDENDPFWNQLLSFSNNLQLSK
jgi:hypothetical protein